MLYCDSSLPWLLFLSLTFPSDSFLVRSPTIPPLPFVFFSIPRLTISSDGEGASILILDPAMPSDVGLYKIVARNQLGQVETGEHIRDVFVKKITHA